MWGWALFLCLESVLPLRHQSSPLSSKLLCLWGPPRASTV
nr:MAG TPA: hypothetical protein [Caudoviricetes sp.]